MASDDIGHRLGGPEFKYVWEVSGLRQNVPQSLTCCIVAALKVALQQATRSSSEEALPLRVNAQVRQLDFY